MKLIVGLGNPGSEYVGTRHNIGFQIIEEFAERHNITLLKSTSTSIYGSGFINGEKVFLIKPLTFMNLSGKSVKEFVKKYKIFDKDILVIHDDKDIELGKNKFQNAGGSAGHNGIKNIIEEIGDKFNRGRIGIKTNSNIPTKDFVLGKFELSELQKIDYEKIFLGIENFILNGIIDTMNLFNSF